MPGVAGRTAYDLKYAVDQVCPLLSADVPLITVFNDLGSGPRGLTESDAADRLRIHGGNDQRPSHDGIWHRLQSAAGSPFVALLAGLGCLLAVVNDARGTVTVAVMVLMAVGLRYWQHARSAQTTRELSKLITTTVTVRRRASADAQPREREVPVADLVPGDVVVLHAGDIVPADLRVIATGRLLVDEAAFTGESLPVEKSAENIEPTGNPVASAPQVCFASTAVVSGSAVAIVTATGQHTYGRSLALAANVLRPESSFDRGVRAVGWTLIRFMLVLAPIVLVVNGVVRGNWAEAAMFAVAVAVALTPEMLPVIVTTNLARGAIRLSQERVVVNRLNAIQDLGALEVLCVDKTGTLTEDRIGYAHSVDPLGRLNTSVTEYAYVAVHFQDTGHNRLDEAITDLLADGDMPVVAEAAYDKIDEVGFDQVRRRSSVVVAQRRDEHIVICKGDPDQILPRCSFVRLDDQTLPFDDDTRAEASEVLYAYRAHGMRVLAVAMKSNCAKLGRYTESDETDLVLIGFIGFVDPVRESSADAVRRLHEHGVTVKMLTGDAKTVALQVAQQVGLPTTPALTGAQIDKLSDTRLQAKAQRCSVFAELTPAHKARIVAALQHSGHAVGFLGDGVNDIPALRIADAGIAADTAADVVKDVADLVLLDKNLAVIADGVLEGRRTLANTLKYVKITASSNFGNVLTVVTASAFLPFLPMLPLQLMVQNLLYDSSQLALPWDRVDPQFLRVPRRWQSIGLVRFMVVFGSLSSLFDLCTFAVLWYGFGLGDAPSAFQTAWFVESTLSQVLIVLVLRTPGVPWRRPRPSPVLLRSTMTAAAIASFLPFSPLAPLLGMTRLPGGIWLLMVAITVAYALTVQLAKRHFAGNNGSWP
ncbi:MAG: magnesium-translocating P-type ATPase [Mycobacterium sp.]